MEDKIRFACVCGKNVSAPPSLAGKKAKCPRCGQVFRVPSPLAADAGRILAIERKSIAEPFIDFPDFPQPATAVPPSVRATDFGPPPNSSSSLFGELSDLTLPEASKKRCPSCDSSIPVDAIICPKCSSNLSYIKPTPKFATPSPARLSLKLSGLAGVPELKTARRVLIGVGILQILVNGMFMVVAKQSLKEAVDKALAARNLNRLVVNQNKLNAAEEAGLQRIYLIDGGFIAIGVIFIIAGFLMPKFPLQASLTSLMLYVGGAIAQYVFNPDSLDIGGIVFKGLVVVALFKAVQAGLAYRGETQYSY